MQGVAGTNPGGATSGDAKAPDIFLNAAANLSDYACPIEDRYVVLNPAGQASSVAGLAGLFNPQSIISEQYTKGEMGAALGYSSFKMDQNVNRHTCGTRTATGVCSIRGGSQSGATLDLTVNSGATIKAGDVFYIASGTAVNTVNPETKMDTGRAQKFVVTEDVSTAGTTLTVAISPSIILSGPTQTVTASPDNSASVTFVGTASTTYAQNVAYHKDAFTLVTADLVLPKGVDFAARETFDGISARIIRQYDINNDNLPCRLDIMYGWATLRPELACRIIGN